MKRPWIISGFTAFGVVAIAAAAFGSSFSGLYLIRPARLGLLLLGLLLLAGAMEARGLLHLGAHVTAHHDTYVQVARTSALVAVAAVVVAGYVFFISLGTWTTWPPTTDYYDRLASAFRSGHVYVKEQPDPALLALPNPYDPEARKGIPGLAAESPGTIWDMTLYRGRVYLYWGPAPALLLLPVKALIPLVFGDQVLTLAFLVGAFVFESLILVRLWRSHFHAVAAWLLPAALLLAGFANPVPWLLFSPRIYEAAIAAGQFFLMGGLLFLLSGLDHEPVAHGRLTLAAILLIGAVGSRATLTPGVAYLAVMVIAWLWWRRRGLGLGPVLREVAWFGVPLTLGAAALMWYNLARFGSIFEFGFRYAITMLDQNKYHDVLFSLKYLVPNAYLYLINAPALTAQFPFVKPVWDGDYVASFNAQYHSIYNAERIVGLVYAAPFFLLALVPAAVSALPSLTRQTGALATARPTEDFFRWFLLSISGLAALQLLVVFLVFYSTMRYFMDVAATLTIASTLGFWLIYQRLASHRTWQVLYALLAIGALVFTVAMGILTGFSSDVPRLRATNPALLAHLKLFFIALGRRLGW